MFELRRDAGSYLSEQMGMEGQCFRQENTVYTGPEARRYLACVIAPECPSWPEPREQVKVSPEEVGRSSNADAEGRVKSFS